MAQKNYIGAGIQVELICHAAEGGEINSRVYPIIAELDFWEALDGLFYENRHDGKDTELKADEIVIRYKDKTFILKK